MVPYYFLIFAPVLPWLFKVKTNKHIKRNVNQHSISVFFIILLLLLMLRAPFLGRDLNTYRYLFYKFSEESWNEIFALRIVEEPAYAVLNKFISLFTNDYQFFLAVVALITVVPIFLVYYREIEDSLLTVSIYIIMSTFVMLFSGLRQSIAIALGMIAFEFTKKKQPIWFLVTVGLAFLFHKSAIMILLMYPLFHIKITKKKIFFIVPIMVVSFIFNYQIFNFLGSFFSDFYESSITETGAYSMLILFSVFIIYSFVISDEKKMDATTTGMRNFLILSVVLQMFAPLNSMAMRMNYYYIIFIPLLIPKIANRASIQMKQVASLSKCIMIVVFVLYFCFTSMNNDVLDIFPYEFFWETNYIC